MEEEERERGIEVGIKKREEGVREGTERGREAVKRERRRGRKWEVVKEMVRRGDKGGGKGKT